MELVKALCLISLTLGMCTLFFVSKTNTLSSSTKVPLLSFIAILQLPMLDTYLGLIEHPVLIIYQAHLLMTWFFAPICLLLVRSLLLLPKHNALLHFMPPTIGAVLSALFVNSQLGYWVFVTSFSGFYLTLVGTLLHQHKARLKRLTNEYTDSHHFFNLCIATISCTLVLFDVVVIFLLYIQVIDYGLGLILFACAVALCVNSLAIGVILKASKPSAEIHASSQQSDALVENPPVNEQNESTKARYFDRELASQLATQLTHLMQTEKLYLDEKVSLPSVADNLGITSHQLSELLNYHMGSSFTDFVNYYRYLEAISLLENSQFTISDIAYQSGFNNRNSFYTSFKKFAGITPTEFRKSKLSTAPA